MGSRYGSLGRNPASEKTILANGGVFEKKLWKLTEAGLRDTGFCQILSDKGKHHETDSSLGPAFGKTHL